MRLDYFLFGGLLDSLKDKIRLKFESQIDKFVVAHFNGLVAGITQVQFCLIRVERNRPLGYDGGLSNL